MCEKILTSICVWRSLRESLTSGNDGRQGMVNWCPVGANKNTIFSLNNNFVSSENTIVGNYYVNDFFVF